MLRQDDAKLRPEDDELEDELVAADAWDTALVRRLLGEAHPHARLFAGTFAILVTLFGLELCGPWILRQAIDGPVAEAVRARDVQGDAFEAALDLDAD